MKTSINQEICLTQDEKKILKQEVQKAWDELPLEMRQFIVEAEKQKLKALYMLEDWAKKNGHETMLNLLSRRIACKEAHIENLESSL